MATALPDTKERAEMVELWAAAREADLAALPFLKCYISVSDNWLIFDRRTVVTDHNYFRVPLLEGTLVEGPYARVSLDNTVCTKSSASTDNSLS